MQKQWCPKHFSNTFEISYIIYLFFFKVLSERIVGITANVVFPFQVSGEYAMFYYGAKCGAFDLKQAVYEFVESLHRAGLYYAILLGDFIRIWLLNIKQIWAN